MIDKPGKGRDYYHTCYALSGLSVAQYIMSATSPDDANVIGVDTNKVVSVQNRGLGGRKQKILALERYIDDPSIWKDIIPFPSSDFLILFAK